MAKVIVVFICGIMILKVKKEEVNCAEDLYFSSFCFNRKFLPSEIRFLKYKKKIHYKKHSPQNTNADP